MRPATLRHLALALAILVVVYLVAVLGALAAARPAGASDPLPVPGSTGVAIGEPVTICATPDNGPTTCSPGQWYTAPFVAPAEAVVATPRMAG